MNRGKTCLRSATDLWMSGSDRLMQFRLVLEVELSMCRRRALPAPYLIPAASASPRNRRRPRFAAACVGSRDSGSLLSPRAEVGAAELEPDGDI